MKRPRALVLAEAANPEWTSVPLVGWSHCHALSQAVDTHVVTQVRNTDAIIRAGWQQGREFTAIDTEELARPLWYIDRVLRNLGFGWTTTTALANVSYRGFERRVWDSFGARITAHEFDLVHRLTPVSPTIPSPIARRCKLAGVPFVWGPVNGGVAWPRQFGRVRVREGEWLSYLRDAHKLLPGYASTRMNASAIIIGSRDTWAQMPSQHHSRCIYIPENAIDPARFPITQRSQHRASLPLRLAFVGRLVPYKGADMLIEAAAPLVCRGLVHVDVIGDGPERERLLALAATLGCRTGIEFPGWIEHGELHARLGKSDVFAFPSIREFGGGVVLEAMALGLVPIVVDYAGPSELVSEQTGIKIPLDTREGIVTSIRAHIERLVDEPELLANIGARARARAMTLFTWEAKARQMVEVYRWVLGERSKPDFGMPFPELVTEPERLAVSSA